MIQLRPRLMSALLPLALAAAAASCAEPLAPPDPGAVLFEVESVNFAWGRSWNGFVVDAQGGVYAYDLSDVGGVPPEGDTFTAEDLAAKYAHHRRAVRSLSADEVASRYAEVARVLGGHVTEPKYVCADAGTTTYSALLYDASTGRYRRLLLHQRGDLARANTAPASRALYRWLSEVTATAVDPDACDPYGG